MKLFRELKDKVEGLVRKMKSKFDKGGSYTGSPDSQTEQKPQQDADDL